jgi:hypothetical protein
MYQVIPLKDLHVGHNILSQAKGTLPLDGSLIHVALAPVKSLSGELLMAPMKI